MRKFYFWFIGTLFFLVMAGCNTSSSDPAPAKPDPPVAQRIVLSATALSIPADGMETTTLSATCYDQNNKPLAADGVAFFIGDTEIAATFRTTTPGAYEITARWNTLRSAPVTITATLPEVTLTENGRLLTKADLAAVKAYDSAGDTLRFTKAAGETFHEGDVLVSGVSDHFPAGILAKVAEVSREGETVVIRVEDAQLTDLVEKGRVRHQVDLKKENIRSIRSAYSGIRVLESPRRPQDVDVDFVLEIDSVIHDGDSNPATSDDQIRLTGELTIDPGIDFTISIDWATIEEFTFGVHTNITGNLAISGDIDEKWQKEIVIASYTFAPITFPLGTIPIVLTPSMDLVVGAKGEVEGKFRWSLSEQAVAEVKAGYVEGDGWDGHHKFTNDFDYSEPRIDGNAQAKIYTGAKISIALFHDAIAAGYGKVLLYFKGEADIHDNPWWCFSGGVESVLGFEGLGLGSFDYTTPIFEKKIVCANAFGDGAYNPENQAETGWAKQFPVPQTMSEDVFLTHNILQRVLPLPQNKFTATGSEPYFCSSFLSYDQTGNITSKAFLKNKEEGAMVFHTYDMAEDGDHFILAGIGGEGLILTRVDGAGKSAWAFSVPVGVTLSKPLVSKIGDGTFLAAIGAEFLVFDRNGTIQKTGSMKYDLDPQDTGEEAMFVEIAGAAPHENGYFVVASFGLFSRGMIAKYDGNHTLLWSRHVGIPDAEDPDVRLAKPTTVTPTGTGGIYIAGDLPNPFVARIDSDGTTRWLRKMETAAFFVKDAAKTKDGGVLVVANVANSADPMGEDRYESFIMKFSADGVFAFAKKVADQKESLQLNGIAERMDGKMGTAVGARKKDGRYQPFAISFTPLGEILLEKDASIQVTNVGDAIVTNLPLASAIGNCEITTTQKTPVPVQIGTYDLPMEATLSF